VKYEEAKGKEALFKSVEDKAEKLIENYVNQKLNQIDNINEKIQELDGKINHIGQNKMKSKLKDKNSTSESNVSVESTSKPSDYNPDPYNLNKTNK
jgi:peptidoglycan hydrolase CwlO-like protein